MPYKPSLMTKLHADFEETARCYMDTRDHEGELSERYLYRLKLLGRDMEIVQKLIDGTLGKNPPMPISPRTSAV